MSTTARDTERSTPERRPRSGGASRDYSRGGTTVLDRGSVERERRHAHLSHRTSSPNRSLRPQREEPQHLYDTPVRKKPLQRKLGSGQVVSVRGRRTGNAKQTTKLARLILVVTVLLIGGIAIAMGLSAHSTEQTFRMQQLVSQEAQLGNQLETLNRDLENASAAAEIARKSAEMGMAIPNQPGILTVSGNGEIIEQRSADGSTRPIIDVNGEQVRPSPASSNPEETDELSDNLAAIPEGESARPAPQAPAAELPAVAPYQPNIPAPAPAPAAPQAEAPAGVAPQAEQAGESAQ
ncbi:hypothetical protein COCCU_09445 [Corynebacterium occultum]|uniref:Cell division protein FtsL n=1 Tax=Corynebacterium occultum TaxID=2675219 RepID=A0A6B8VUF3_9CORY|nr:hypothetical protein [Corynebacterium occultum]QGU07813.1 hypothetical protein COCCU_09445 [Corynebacterium occultum]